MINNACNMTIKLTYYKKKKRVNNLTKSYRSTYHENWCLL